MKLAANLSWLYADEPRVERRFEAAVRDGFEAVEVLLPYNQSPDWYGGVVRRSGVVLALINTPVGEGAAFRGYAAVPGAEKEFSSAFDLALAVALATGCRCIHVMAGHVESFDAAQSRATLLGNLEHALRRAEPHGIRLTLEALNRTDMGGYFYWLPAQAIEIVRNFDSPLLRLQFDFYHCVMEGLDPRNEVDAAAPWIGYAQIAGVPGRYEPNLGQDHLLEAVQRLHASGYNGWLGCEHRPRTTAAEGLGWCALLRGSGVLS